MLKKKILPQILKQAFNANHQCQNLQMLQNTRTRRLTHLRHSPNPLAEEKMNLIRNNLII